MCCFFAVKKDVDDIRRGDFKEPRREDEYGTSVMGIQFSKSRVIDHGQVNEIKNPERQMLIDNFILDVENKAIERYDKETEDSFIDDLKDLEKIEIKRDTEKGNGIRTITIKKKNQETPIIIVIDKNNQIIGYKNNEMATSEIDLGKKIIEELKSPFKKIDNNER